MGETQRDRTIYLIESDDAEPQVKLTPGKRYDVISTTVVDRDLRQVQESAEKPAVRPPRLCGSRSTCMAIVEIPIE
jgi:hypothetical protein